MAGEMNARRLALKALYWIAVLAVSLQTQNLLVSLLDPHYVSSQDVYGQFGNVYAV